MPRTIGVSRAKEMCITGRQVAADEALRIGLLDEVVATDELHTRALALAADVARGALASQALVKSAIDRGIASELGDALAIEKQAFVAAFHTDDSQIGVQCFLANGPGKASFTGK